MAQRTGNSRRDFASRPVTPQNLSEWRQGFNNWLSLRHSYYLAAKVKLTTQKTSTSRSSDFDLSSLFSG